MSAATPKVLDIIRTAAADCTDSVARKNLLEAASMTRGLLDALTLLLDRERQDDEGAKTLQCARSMAARAIAKATGEAS